MITEAEVQEIFEARLPDDVTVVLVPRLEFVGAALGNPFIQKQIQVGIYDLDNIWTDFLSPACSYTAFRKLEVCYDLIVAHAEGITDEDLIRSYVTMMALHEAHHFHVNQVPDGPRGHAEAEVDCIRETTEANPELSDKAAQFEAESAVFQRVYDRMRTKFPKAFS